MKAGRKSFTANIILIFCTIFILNLRGTLTDLPMLYIFYSSFTKNVVERCSIYRGVIVVFT